MRQRINPKRNKKIQTYFRDIIGLVPDHNNKAKIEIK